MTEAVTTTTTTTTRTERRVHWVARGVVWGLAPLVDGWSGLSLNRFLAIGFGVTAVHGRLGHDLALTGWDCTMATISGSLAFGKDLFTVFLTRKDARENRETHPTENPG